MAKKKRKQRPEGYDPNEARRQRLEARRQAKAEAEAARRRAQLRERVIRWLVLAGIVLFGFWFLFIRGQAPDSISGANGEYAVEHLALAGGGEHVETPVTYDTEPPVSGPHSQRAAACGTHGNPIPGENFVHTLEHGAVGIVYKVPDTPVEMIEEIEAVVNDYDSHTISAPNIDMEDRIAVVAWGHMMKMDDFDEEAARSFIDEFRQAGDAPEAYQDCPNTSSESGAVVPSPSPSPTPSEEAPDQGSDDGDRQRDKDKGKS